MDSSGKLQAAAVRPSLSRRFYRLAEATDTLGVDAETLRQAILRHDDDPLRLPLYFEVSHGLRAVFVPDHLLEQAYQSGHSRMRRSTTTPSAGSVAGIPAAKQLRPLEERAVTLAGGLWIEVDAMHCREMASLPHRTTGLHFFRAPAHALGVIPARALITVVDVPSPEADLTGCWLRAEDLERLLALPTEGQRDIAEGKSEDLSTKEWKTVLRIIRALCVMVKMPPRGGAKSVELQIEKLGFKGPIDDTIQPILKEAFALKPDRPADAIGPV